MHWFLVCFLFVLFNVKIVDCAILESGFAENIWSPPLAIAALRKVFSNFVRFLVGLENHEKCITTWLSRLFVCGGVTKSTGGRSPGCHPARPDERQNLTKIEK